MNNRIGSAACVLIGVIAIPGAALAQQPYPAKTVRMILPFAPGGPSDIIGRTLSSKLTEQLGQQVVADNRPGAGGNLGQLEHRAQSPADAAGARNLSWQCYACHMGKRPPKQLFEDNPFVDDLLDWMGSAEGELSGVARDVVWTALEKVDVDARQRQLIWEDGKRLSITESVQRLHADYPDFPLELIEERLIGWLEMDFAPPTYSEEQLDELDRLTEKWIDDHERQVEAAQKRARTRHS